MKSFWKKVGNHLLSILKGFVQQKKLYLRLPICLAAVIVMGFCLSWLILVNWGTDPCTALNLAIAAKLHLTLGNWQAIINSVLFIVVIIFGNNDLGFGTLANMFLVGYSCDFFSWIWSKCLPADFMTMYATTVGPVPVEPIRIAIFVVALALFIVAAALYMDMKLGTSPYDAISFIIQNKLLKKIPFRFVRMGYDLVVVGLALLFGSQNVGPVTIVIALFLGIVIEFLGKKISKVLDF